MDWIPDWTATIAFLCAVLAVLTVAAATMWLAVSLARDDAPGGDAQGDDFDASTGRWGYLHDRREGGE